MTTQTALLIMIPHYLIHCVFPFVVDNVFVWGYRGNSCFILTGHNFYMSFFSLNHHETLSVILRHRSPSKVNDEGARRLPFPLRSLSRPGWVSWVGFFTFLSFL